MSDRSPVFSVIIPTHNRAAVLPTAIRSVLSQTFRDFELLVVDDASKDSTESVVESFGDPRIRYIRQEKNQGVAVARNTGIRQSRGNYISFLDDDDEYLPLFLEKTFEAFDSASSEVGFSWCGTREFITTENGEEWLREGVWLPKFRDREHAYLSFLKSRRIGTNCGLAIRRSTFDLVGLFDEEIRNAEDTDFLIRMARSVDFITVPEKLIKIHFHPESSLRSDTKAQAGGYDLIIEKHKEALKSDPSLWVSLHYKAGWLHYHSGNKKQGRRHMVEAIKKQNFNLKCWFGLILFETLGPLAFGIHKRLWAWKAG